MQDRTVACGLTSLDQHEKNLLSSTPKVLKNEQVFLYQTKLQLNSGLQRSQNPNHMSEVENLLLEPQLDTMLLSNFDHYQNIIEEKIMSATLNISHDSNSQQVANIRQVPFSFPASSEQPEQNLLDNMKDPIYQAILQIKRLRLGQIQTEIQSKLNENLDLAKIIIQAKIQRTEKQYLDQKEIYEPTEGVIPNLQNAFKESQQELFIHHAIINDRHTENSQSLLLSNQEPRVQENIIENNPSKSLQFQNIDLEKSEYSLNSDNLLGIFQDKITNTEARTDFILKKISQNRFDFSEQPQIRLEESQAQQNQSLNQEYQKAQNFQTSLISIPQKYLEENNNSSLQVNINSDSKNNIWQERNQLSFYQRNTEIIYQGLQRQNFLGRENNHNQLTCYNQHVTQYHQQSKQQELNTAINESIMQEGQKNRIIQSQVDNKSYNFSQSQKTQFSFQPSNKFNKEQEKPLGFLLVNHQQEYQPSVINKCQQIIQMRGQNQIVIENKKEILQIVQEYPICENQQVSCEATNKINDEKQFESNQAQHIYSEIPNEKNLQIQEMDCQEVISIQNKEQVDLLNIIQVQSLQQQPNEIVKKIVFEIPYVNNTNYSNAQQQQRIQLKNQNQQIRQQIDLNKSQAKSQVQPIKAYNIKQSQIFEESNKFRKARKDEQAFKGPSINIYNSYNSTRGKEQNNSEQFAYNSNNFDGFKNVQPCININISRDNQISLNLFRNFTNFENNLQNVSNLRNREKLQQNLTQNLNLITNNSSRQVQRDIKSSFVEKKQLQETAIQTTFEQENYFDRNRNKNLSSQKQIQIQGNSINQSRQESLSQKLNKIRKISDYYMLSGYISQQEHKQFQQILKNHVLIRFSPEPLDNLGTEIFKDGLIMVAIVKMLSRSSKTPFLQSYIYQYLQSAFTIQSNNYLFIQESNKAKQKFQIFLAENHQKKIKQQTIRNQQPIKRKGQSINLQRKLTLQSNNVSINEKVNIQTRIKQANLIIDSPVQKIKVSTAYIQPEKFSIQSQTFQRNIKELNNNKHKIIQKKSTKSNVEIPEKNNSKVYPEQKKKKENDQTIAKHKPQKKLQKAEVILQEESPTDSIQENDDTNLKSNIEFQNENHPAQSPYQENNSKIQKANKSKYADLKLNSFQKNECVMKVEACLQDRNTKFNQLYERYKKIRQVKTNETSILQSIPCEQKVVSITKPIIKQSKEKDSVVEKKRKAVQFIDEPLELKKEQAETETQEDEGRNRKRRRSKKAENSVAEEQEQTSKVRKSRK